jgi:lipopolysaccharide O-acetyltransferase
MIVAEIFLTVVQLPSKIRNRLFNLIFSILCRSYIRIAWSEVKIIGMSNIRFGKHFLAGRGLWLQAIGDGIISFGDNINVSDWVHIAALQQVVIGNGCLMGSKVLITDHSHGTVTDILSEASLRPDKRLLNSKGPVVLEDNVWLGDAVVVLSGVRIGRNAIIGANSVVTHDIPNNTVWAGVPAKQIWPTPI